MRDIKFRAWDENTQTMITPFIDIVEFPETELCLKIKVLRQQWGEHEDFVSTEIMQYTGLKDKNGVDIYADDIIKSSRNTYRVYSVSGGYGIKADYWSEDKSDMTEMDEIILHSLSDCQTKTWVSELCEVIGNIYQTPELLTH